jgi:PRTRC genetic system ThiF family protein
MEINLNLEYANGCKLLLPTADTVILALIGCGGTGSWLAPSVVRVARMLIEKFQKRTDVYFIDPDRVEEKNCFRQNFCQAEIGRNKADTLAYRYGLAWGVPVIAVPKAFNPTLIKPATGSQLILLIGCVDNAEARKMIQADAGISYRNDARVWWLDCGNAKSSGQILLGSGSKQPENAFEIPGFCSWLPLPTVAHPELLETQPESVELTENLSCADMALSDSQGMAINQRIAAEASDYLVRMLLTKDLRKYATYIDLESGTTRSKYIHPGMATE